MIKFETAYQDVFVIFSWNLSDKFIADIWWNRVFYFKLNHNSIPTMLLLFSHENSARNTHE